MNKNNKRTANYTKDECWRLVEIVEKFVHVVENKKNDAVTWKQKKRVWHDIYVQFNSCAIYNRTSEQLRSKYETLKKETRRALAENKKGNPSGNKMEPLLEKVRSLMQLSSNGAPCSVDSDIEASTSQQSIKIEVNDINDDTVDQSNLNMELAEINSESNSGGNKWNGCLGGTTDTCEVGQNVEPSIMVTSETELSNVKLRLLQQEFDAKQQRELELHEQLIKLNNQKMEINKLVIEKLNLEIQSLKRNS
ncbi:apontic [Holotrichia oblita]|uniref:Apontic n=1 Tax=Holotrichia oblita TaxID=644536 RepID=A0ACB9THJ7_HOLOL|nr:apontic [Holotrichia oblita]